MRLSYDKKELDKAARAKELKFVIVHGSQALGESRPDSDVDIAVVPARILTPKKFMKLYEDMGKVFGNNEQRELDLKVLQRADSEMRSYYFTMTLR